MAIQYERMYVDSRFGQMHMRTARPEKRTTKNPLICFHLSPYSSVVYETFVREMGKDRLCIAIDSPGFGHSDPTPEPPLIPDYSAAMSDVVDALGIERADLIGFHTGSKVALELGRQRPDVVNKAILISIAYWTPDEIKNREVIIKAPEIKEDGSHLKKAWDGSMRWSMTGRTPMMLAKLFYAHTINPAITHWGHQAAYQYDVEAAMDEIKQPILVLNPEDDLWNETPRIKPLLKQRGSQFMDLPGWAHGFMELKTDEFSKIVRDFLD